MRDYSFIQENSHWTKMWILFTSILLLIILLMIGIFFSTSSWSALHSIPYINGWVGFVTLNIKSLSLFGLFLANLIGGIFFVPSPDELIFYYGLIKGNNYILAIIFSVIGYMIAQVMNYYLGKKISIVIMDIVSKKKIYDTRRFVNKHGALGIFLFNFLPLPGPLLTFALGIARYNFTRLFVLTLIGKIMKYTAITLIYLIFV